MNIENSELFITKIGKVNKCSLSETCQFLITSQCSNKWVAIRNNLQNICFYLP